MKTIVIGIILCTQVMVNQSSNEKQERTMENQLNEKGRMKRKAIIRNLYEGILNTGKLALLEEIISADYTGVRGEKGAEGFAATVNSIRIGFPDIRWVVEDLLAEGDKVVIRWSWKGTNTGSFRGFPASNNEVVDHAIAIYEFNDDDKIIRSWIQSDKLGFLQQIGIIPTDITHRQRKNEKDGC